MKIKAWSLFLALALLSVGLAEEPRQTAKRHLQQAHSTGSLLSLKSAQLLNRKHALQMSLSYVRPSRYGLSSEVFGGFSLAEGAYRGSLDLFTGQRAIDESLQLDTIRAQNSRQQSRQLAIDSVKSLTIESHPWESMLEEVKPETKVSPLLQLVPHDHFVIQFSSGASAEELEGTLQELSSGLDHIFDLQKSFEIRRQVAQRLGLESLLKYQNRFGEFAFVSEDLDFFPGTHYALVLDLGKWSKRPGISLAESPTHGRLGRYFVAASSPALFQRIKNVRRGDLPSMAESLDYQYANAVIDHPRDGLAYLSEAFILKLVSPRHRINSSRRLHAIDTLVDAQYTVWAYRDLTGEWPQSFAQMEEQGYLATQDLDRYLSIRPNGDVENEVWGSLSDLKALSEVSVETVSKQEAESYNTFRERYQQYWSQYFDPIGVGFRLDQALTFHTIILPLIDNSDYRRLSRIAGGAAVEFDGVPSPDLAGLSIHSRMNYLALYGFLAGFREQPEGSTTEEYYEALNRSLNEHCRLNPPIDFLKLFGDEISLMYLGEGAALHNPERTVLLGLELNNPGEFQRLLETLLEEVGDTSEHKTQGGSEYREIPFWGSTHLFLSQKDQFFYIALSERVLQKFLDTPKPFAPPHSAFQGHQQIGSAHNLVWRGDFRNSSLLENLYLRGLSEFDTSRQFREALGYLQDQSKLQVLLGPEQSSKLLSTPLHKLHGVPLQHTARGPLAGGYSLEQLKKIPDLILSHRTPEAREALKSLQWLTVGLEFTPEGLSTRVVVNRPSNRRSWFR